MSDNDTVGGYRGSGDGSTMRPPAPLPSAAMTRPNGRSPAPYEVLKSRDALLEAAKLNQTALDLLDTDLEEAVKAAQVALSLSTYALAVDRWSP